MSKLKDLTGQKFGRLEVVGRAENGKGRHSRWHYVCACGIKGVARGTSLTSGRQKSCGCLLQESRRKNGLKLILPNGEGAFNNLLRDYQHSAKRRGHAWGLTKEQLRDLTKQHCFYCNRPPSNTKKGRDRAKDYVYSGVDRLLNTEDYSLANCRACCADCNKAKSTMAVDEFLAWVERVYNHSIANGNGSGETHTGKTRPEIASAENPVQKALVLGKSR